MHEVSISQILDIAGWKVRGEPWLLDDEGQRREIMVELVREKAQYYCPCGRCFKRYYDGDFRHVRDLSFGAWDMTLVYYQVRVECPECGVKTEQLAWLDRGQRHTKRFANYVGCLCQIASVAAVAQHLGLDWKTVKRFDKQALQQALNPPQLSGLKLLAVDEIAIKKGHKYATIILDFETRRVVWAAPERTADTLSQFYAMLGQKRCQKIEAVAMDMWPAYQTATQQHCPNAEIVFDKFHILAHFAKVIDNVRKQQLALANAQGRQLLRGTKYLLLKNWDKLSRNQRERLNQLLAVNEPLNMVYILKDDLKRLWTYVYPGAAQAFFNQWYKTAKATGIECLQRFADMLARHLHGILAYCRYPINTSVLEGINNKAKVIKRMAYGFHDIQYFFLKLRAATMKAGY